MSRLQFNCRDFICLQRFINKKTFYEDVVCVAHLCHLLFPRDWVCSSLVLNIGACMLSSPSTMDS